MTCVPDEIRPPSEPAAVLPAPNRQRRRTCPVRLAGVILLLVWVGPVTFVQTDTWRLLQLVGAPGPASAGSQVIPAGKALVLAPKTSLKLHLRDGSVVEGRFVGRTLLDPTRYASRFEDHVRSSVYVPLMLDEPLQVTLRDGREWTAPFAGYGELSVLLRSPDGSEHLRVPVESLSEVRRSNGDRVVLLDMLLALQAHALPSAEALELEERGRAGQVMERWEDPIRVAVDDIERAVANYDSGIGVGGIIVLSLIATLVLVVVLTAVIASSFFNGCSNVGSRIDAGSFGVRLTTRPFDRYRGRYVGEALAEADPWPRSIDGSAVTIVEDGSSPGMSRHP